MGCPLILPFSVKSLPGSLRQQDAVDEEGDLTSVIPETGGSVLDTSTMSQAPSFHGSNHNDNNSILEDFTPVRPTAKSTLTSSLHDSNSKYLPGIAQNRLNSILRKGPISLRK